ncbi:MULTISPECIES: ATP-binding protein [Undibacterium]|jgi:signal transduction histidine kinase|uniref:histidine kinase n=1 Tax=Undibacterium umbellatum TaxID=2762300 RepID=A0ABR6ZBJ3_9BURK|nr:MULTISPECIES: ATP-binding protein [Undibacterium]MBC3908936.1 HAMP domain-containing protein [Undibacterium umbellatum]MDP1978834.1 ATP-binding protein [Undibacterium sp.]
MKILSSMWGRVFAILLLGVIASTVLTWSLAFGERQKTISQYRDSHAVERAEQLVLALDALPAENREKFLATAPRLGLKVATLPAETSDQAPRSEYAAAVSERLGKTFRVMSLAQDPGSCPRMPQNIQTNRLPCEALGITLNDGTALRLTVLPPRNPAPPLRPDFLQYLFLFLASIAILAFLIARMTMRPLQQMAKAATALGQDINRPPLPEKGATEILLATRAFNAMQARIRQHIAQRTHMLAAITHDLQTPLTRLRLRLEKVRDEELRDKLIEDLSGMQMMIREGLDLARSMDSNEALKPCDLDSLLDSVCADAADAGQNVSFEGKPGLTVMARPQALRRCLTNLIDNAVKYGHYATVSLVAGKDAAKDVLHVLIRDGGTGIPPEFQSKVFEPFFRMETSRSRESGGTGLGLTIAQNIAQQHGGQLQLNNLPEGGLEVRLTLPVQSA